MRRPRLILFVIALALVVAGLFNFLKKGTSELPVYTEGAARMVAQEEIYRRDDAKPFTYPPFFAVPFVPMTLLPQDQDSQRAVWYFANIGVLVLIVVMLRSIVRPALVVGRAGESAGSATKREVWFWVCVAALSLRHVLAVFQNQSHDLLVCAAVTGAAWWWGRKSGGRSRGFGGGAWVGLGAACKATPLLFGLPFLLQRRIGPLLGMGVAFAGLSLVPDVLFPRVDGKLWILAWYEIMVAQIGVGETAAADGVWHAGSYLNQGLSGTLYRLTTPLEPTKFVVDIAPVHLGETTRKVVTMLGQVAVLGLVALAALRRLEDGPRRGLHALGIVGATACGMVLLSPMSSKAHFCVLILPAAYGVATWLTGRRDVVMGALLLGAFVVGTLTTKGVLQRELGEMALAAGAVTWATVLFLLATAHGLFYRRHEASVTSALDTVLPD